MAPENGNLTEFLREADSQPEALADLIEFYRTEGAPLLTRWRELLAKYSRVEFIGMGTSEIAPLLIRSSLASAGIGVSIVDAGEYVHYHNADPAEGTLSVLISQSGESAETKKATAALAGQGAPVAVIVNDEDSSMAAAAKLVLPLKAGDENSISSKTYLNTLSVLHLMAGGELAELDKVAGTIGRGLDKPAIISAAEHLMPADSIHFIGRGPALCSAGQLALTFMEGAQAHGRAFTGGAFRHGPYEVLGPGHRAVVLAPGGRTVKLCLAMANEMAGAGSHVVLVTDLDEIEPRENLVVLKVKNPVGERTFPLAFARVQAWLLHHVARLRGYEAGFLSRVSKVTDVE
ncbi:MAG: SIS domain-containing protein [Candidatus Glassbacteria bacterium]|nr:SIS domain-containing protein [Candidatus Glassbacteria bacterium]